MKHLLILGGGTAGTMVANRLVHKLDAQQWQITLVDADETHLYQPGLLFIPFGIYDKGDVIKPRRDYLPKGIEVIIAAIDLIEPDQNRVRIASESNGSNGDGGRYLSYDYLVIATGSRIAPEETPGLMEEGWRRSIYDFYSLDGALALAYQLRGWQGGQLVVHISEMPIKCPVAPLEFLFLADWYFHERGMRDKVELTLATPLPGAFTKPKAASLLDNMLKEKNIQVVPEFNVERVAPDEKAVYGYDGQKVAYDLLVSVPVNMGSAVIERSGIGDDLNFVPTDKHTLKAKEFDNVFVLGDATNLPSSKAGSVAHFEVDGFVDNFMRYIEGQQLLPTFDGHANCFIESGYGKGLLVDFNYNVEPLPGKYPLPGVGPFTLLQESHANHWGKLMFRWVYWNILLKGHSMPVPVQMSMAGKQY